MLRLRSVWGYRCCGSGPDTHESALILVGWIRIQEGKNARKKWRHSMFWSAACSLLTAWGFSYSLEAFLGFKTLYSDPDLHWNQCGSTTLDATLHTCRIAYEDCIWSIALLHFVPTLCYHTVKNTGIYCCTILRTVHKHNFHANLLRYILYLY